MQNAAPKDGARDQTRQTDRTAPLRQNTTREIDWLAVNQYVTPRIARLGQPVPLPGSVAWCTLYNHDPLKLGSCLMVVPWWAVDQGTRQDALREAGLAISAAADWTGIVRGQAQRRKAVADGAYIPRRST
ncbi:hypothetical protein Y900_004300 [Mycolicibacterium aromaticivorans JS19b1 = JCM 16368]|uniref:Uncharacterized protein n=1 Tax=Mycolicibacterium aromaticivorans JS19b1 = JCM 16368 TaxID=1440774 RepID=A0A064CHD6_9MYCO|nr:DUF2742 domain-containing protein [Mycolicibacterium aromaticivorans]KDE98182.1 hypothetical protein Y900_004300 [Mycolicibacterium aromaticivorans JS19b1 = JCM 16368]